MTPRANGRKGQGTGDLIRALALKQSGRAAEAEQLLKDWQAQDPGSELAKWGAETFAGRPAPLPASLQTLDCRVIAGVALASVSTLVIFRLFHVI